MSGELTTKAFCWKLERRDGFGLALTSHDEPIVVGGIRYDPAPGMTPSSIRRELGLDPTTSEIQGAISSGSIVEDDLIIGRWDDSALTLVAVEWSDPDQKVPLVEGVLGRIQINGREFSTEILGAAAKLRKPVCPFTGPECRAELGDRHCRIDMAGRIVRNQVISSDGHSVILEHDVSPEFRFGALRVLGGAMNGASFTILGVDGDTITLRSSPALILEPGTTVAMKQGCDKRLETCASRFSNAANFRGEPHLPGNDLLTRYPGN